jgi:hypothetical protein
VTRAGNPVRCLDLVGDGVPDASEPRPVELVERRGRELEGPRLRQRPLGHHDDGEVTPHPGAVLEVTTDGVDVERHLGTRIASAPPAMPAYVAIHPACRPITSRTITRLCDSAVECSRSTASVAVRTAVENPMVRSVPATSLSMVFGTPMSGTPASSARRREADSVPSPPMTTRPSSR